jgi:hypothetical protein
MLTVSVRTVDGGLQDWVEPDFLYEKLKALRQGGTTGKQLIFALFTDDWGMPLIGIHIRGILDDGSRVDEWLPFD